MTVVAGCSNCVLSRPFSTARSRITSGNQSPRLPLLNLLPAYRLFPVKPTRDFQLLSASFPPIIGREPSTLHQTARIGIVPVGAIFANALLLTTTPLQALAETCEADQSVFSMNMPLLLLVALIGATVGGLLARQRKAELQRLNEQLLQINAALKRQAKIESYAPSLSYVPAATRVPDNEVVVDPKKQELISHLKSGKTFLRNQNPEKAYFEFKTALELAQKLKDPIEEKKAARGLGASLQRQGKHKEAIKYHSMVLSISEREGEDSGNTEAFGAIADCYTELGDLEKAAAFYDQYIARLQAD